ncbi:MAG: 5'/3'-nucleotidase SurE [Bacillota bacterium]|jgi:5'-nucleotidase|nr:5'/3'-nucleotidase SurE [Bacillota bacterium]HHT91057.1 5'/3'-nucleotidase SurE [Bacillota bacterium]
MRKYLLVNDDGVFAPGLAALVNGVEGRGEITVIAPHQERSGMSQAITVNQPLRLTEVERGYMLDGTPADCVKMGLLGLNLTPDFVLSGINSGANLGSDVLYSGTVAAAMEGVLQGVPSLAFSLCGSAEYFPTASLIIRRMLFDDPGFVIRPELIPKEGVLNINIPALAPDEIKGIRVTRLGVRNYHGLMQRREDPRGNHYYWMGGSPLPSGSKELDIDIVAVEHGYISITPLKFDTSFHEVIPQLKHQLNKDNT